MRMRIHCTLLSTLRSFGNLLKRVKEVFGRLALPLEKKQQRISFTYDFNYRKISSKRFFPSRCSFPRVNKIYCPQQAPLDL